MGRGCFLKFDYELYCDSQITFENAIDILNNMDPKDQESRQNIIPLKI